MKRLLFAIAAIFASVSVAHSQAAFSPDPVMGPTAPVRAGASVLICSHPSTVSSCTANKVTVYSDIGLTTPTTNPTTTDSKGRILVYVPWGTYDYVVSGTGITAQTVPFTFTAGGGPGCTPSGSAGAVQKYSGTPGICSPSSIIDNGSTISYGLPGTHSLSETFSGPLSSIGLTLPNSLMSNILERTLYVGGSNTWAGVDIGAQINNAYALLPSSGGRIVVVCKNDGSRYDFSTPILFTTANKVVRLDSDCPQDPVSTAGATLNYTPTTSTVAITIDYTQAGGSGQAVGGIGNITLINNLCATIGGCGSSATGILVGNTNGGAGSSSFPNLRVQGFGTGFNNPNNTSWGMRFDNCSFQYNNTGFNYSMAENSTFTGCKFIVNGTGFTTSTGEVAFIGGSFDSNTVVGFTCTGALGIQTAYFTDVHFENLGQSNTHFGSGTCNVNLNGGLIENDNVGGSSDWLWSLGGLGSYISGTEVTSSQTLTTGYFNVPASARPYVSIMDGTPTSGNKVVGGTNAASATVLTIAVNTANPGVKMQFGDSNPFTITYKSGSGGGNYTGANTGFANVDTTNLCAAVTIPSGWKLVVNASGVIESVTAAVVQSFALSDIGTTCGGGGVTPLNGSRRDYTPPAAGVFDVPLATQAVINGDGAAHAISLQALTSNAADSWGIQNTSAAAAPSMTLTLTPSN